MDKLKKIKDNFEGCFDVKYRDIKTILGDATLIFIDDLCNGTWLMEYTILPLRGFGKLKDSEITTPQDLLDKVLDMNMAGLAKDVDDAISHVLQGDAILIYENFEEIIYCEAKNFPRRGIGIPETESVLKGPKEGFNELIVDNVALIRRKLKNPNLKFEAVVLGEESNTAVAITYIKGIAPDELVNSIKEKIKNLDLRFILDTNYIEANLKKQKSFFDTVGYTEKPDEIAAKLVEGRIGIIVDGTPFVITVPYFFLENFQMPDDYYLNRYYTNFNRVLRWIAFFIAAFLPGLYVAIITYHFSMIPTLFIFRLAVSRAGVPIPTFIEVLVMMFAFQFIKEAGLRLPHPIGSAMSIVSALILGDAAVGAGIASRITIIVIALSTLSYFLIPKIHGALSFWSIVISLASAAFGLPGFFAGSLIFIIQICELDSVGYPFLFPMGSTEQYSFKDVLFRGRLDRISKKVILRREKVD
ncbi:spore germination protein [Clostridium disporicum]|uniref:Spore germination protein n=1 Tax=Clostridium disporicum TaxID=84024 RepID=A0A174EV77_9CLOT|nr:spore germination protein [Clostridium disporicum]CUO42022.1 spore germination protein [Clostridium disporicum]